MRLRFLSRTGVVLMAIASAQVPAAQLSGSATDNFDIYVDDGLTYDDNLYRLPPGTTSAATAAAPHATLADYINTTSLGATGALLWGLQTIDLDLHVDRNLFVHNVNLDNTSYNEHTVVNWLIGKRLSGDAGIDFGRNLSDFGSGRYLGKDMVDAVRYFGSGRYEVAPRWTVFAGLSDEQVNHSASAPQFNDYHSQSSTGGLEYATADKDLFTADYKYTHATYPSGFELNNILFNDDYRESLARLKAKYALSGRTTIEAFVGYLHRDYPFATRGSFSGDVWNVSVNYALSSKTILALGGWRELQANLDSQSDYFVATGVRLAPEFLFSPKLSLSLAYSWDSETYLASSTSLLLLPDRLDHVTAEQATLSYQPRKYLTVKLIYRHERRESTASAFEYHDQVCSLNVAYTVF